ncbi:hypothetical protein Tco_1282358 [Tanacetum coccineum]
MASMKYCDKHNQVGFLKKPEESTGFAEIVDFLKGSHIRYALTHNLTIHDSLVKQFWQTATASTLADGTLELRATIDTLEYTITEASVRSKLQLADASGISMLPNTEIFEGMGNMGYPADVQKWWMDQFGSNLATALICLSTGRIYNFSKLIFDGMVANLKSKTKFLMYPRFLQMILEIQTENKHPYLAIVLTKKIFGNMKRGFRGVPRPLLPAMLPVVAVDQTEPTTHHTSPSPEPDDEQTEHIFEQPSPEHQPLSPRQETEVPQSQDPSHPHVPEARTMTVEDLLHLVPNLITKVDSLETELKQTKLTMGKAIVKLVKKDIDDDPLGSKGYFVTPTKPSGEAQEEEISPTTLEAAKILSKAKDISTGFEEVNTGFEKGNTGGLGVSTGSGPVSSARGQREGKAPMIVEETQAPKRTKEQIQQEEASLAEAIRLQTLEEEETAKQVHLDALLAKRMEEEELTEQQKQRKAQVQFEAQHYTEEDWDAIRAKLEANAELTKNVLGKELPEEDFAKKMVELVNQRKKFFAEERAKARRSKPMTQSLLRNYMMNYLKNQGTWKLTQLKKLSFKEVKEEFDKLVKQVESFVPIDEIEREWFVAMETEKEKSSEREEEFDIKKPVLRYTLKKIFGKEKDLQKIAESTKLALRRMLKYMDGKSGCLLNDLTRDDLKELYRLMMLKYRDNRPKEEFERVLWGDLKTIVFIVWTMEVASHSIWLTEVKYPLHLEFAKLCLKRSFWEIEKMRHKDWLVQEQTALGKDFSNPFMADNLPNIIMFKDNSKNAVHNILKKAYNEDTQRNLKINVKFNFASQRFDVNMFCPKPVTPHYLPKVIESVFVKPHHVIASGSSRNSSKESYGSNDMAHNYYLKEAKKKTHDKNINLKPSVMHTTSLQNPTNGSKPKRKSNKQTSWSFPVSKSSYGMSNDVPLADHSRDSRPFPDSKHFVCSTCQKCIFNANHDTCIIKFLKEVNYRVKV